MSVPLIFSPTVGLAWDIPTKTLPSFRKRPRPSTFLSADDPGLPSTKKRRLRLVLITSRLSRPFSKPATYIADHGRSRIAVWAKARNLRGRSLRRAAILNSARRSRWGIGFSPNLSSFEERVFDVESRTASSLRESVGPDEDVEGEANLLGAIRQDQSNDKLSAPSPLGLSNYDALDDWSGYTMHHEDYPSSRRNSQPQVTDEDEVYSDFNFLDPVVNSPREDDDEYDDPFSVLPPDWFDEDQPPRPPDRVWRPTEPVGSAA